MVTLTMNSGLVPRFPGNYSETDRTPLRYRCRSGVPRFGAALLVSLVSLVSSAAQAQSGKDGSAAVRRALLRDYLEPHRGRASVARYAPAVFGAATLGLGIGIGVGGIGEDSSGRSRWILAGAYGATSAVSFASYALPADYRMSGLDAALGLLLVGTGAGFFASSRSTDTIRFSTAAIMGTGLVYEGLVISDAALSRPISSATLAGHLERLERGDAISDAELARMERDFARTVRPIPRWAFPLTLAVGGLVAASPVFFSDTSDDDKAVSAVFGVMLLTPAMASIVPLVVSDRNSYTAYQRALRNLRITPLGPAGSTGVTVSGAF
jgi:hypothetical protein